MKKKKLLIPFGIIFLTIVLAVACEQTVEPPPPAEEEPFFKPGEYGGDALNGTEHLYNFQLSPDGSRMALIRSRTPDLPLEPRDQLWILNADGSEPKLIGFNIGTVDWHPDGESLAFTFIIGFSDTFIVTYTLNDPESVRIWSGLEEKFLDMKTTSNPRWFSNGSDLLVSVWGKAFQQSYEPGVYIIDTINNSVEGPLLEFSIGGMLGNQEQYFISSYFPSQSNPLDGNYIKYSFEGEDWDWITAFSKDSLNRWIKQPDPNPQGTELIFQRHTENAWQLFRMESDGSNLRQITELGGNQLRWAPDGSRVYFNRDVHKAPGARYVPHVYELSTGTVEPLWPHLPDSVPQFPALDTQNPVDFFTIVRDSVQASNSN